MEILAIKGWLEPWHQNPPCQGGCLSYTCKCCSRRLHPTVNWADFHMPYLAGAVVERVAVDGASLPVPYLDVAGALGGAAILQWLGGWGPALGRGLEKGTQTFTDESLLHAFVLRLANRFWPLRHLSCKLDKLFMTGSHTVVSWREMQPSHCGGGGFEHNKWTLTGKFWMKMTWVISRRSLTGLLEPLGGFVCRLSLC